MFMDNKNSKNPIRRHMTMYIAMATLSSVIYVGFILGCIYAFFYIGQIFGAF